MDFVHMKLLDSYVASDDDDDDGETVSGQYTNLARLFLGIDEEATIFYTASKSIVSNFIIPPSHICL